MTTASGDRAEPPLQRLKVMIVDDELLARARLVGLVEECAWPPARVIGEAGSAAEALHLLAQCSAAGRPPDALLLDVRMPGVDGLQLAERLRAMERRPAVIFVTAHPEHALRAFDVAAIDYLQKPVRRARLYEALGRLAERRAPAISTGRSGHAELSRPAHATSASNDAAADDPRTLLVQDRGRLLRIGTAELLYMKAEAKYVTVRTEAASHVIDESLADLQHRLGAGFLRIHRNALVAVRAMRELQKRRADEGDDGADAAEGGEAWWLRVAPADEWLAVSRRQLQLVKDALREG